MPAGASGATLDQGRRLARLALQTSSETVSAWSRDGEAAGFRGHFRWAPVTRNAGRSLHRNVRQFTTIRKLWGWPELVAADATAFVDGRHRWPTCADD